MLKIRVITALVLLPIVLVALFLLPRAGWAAFTFAVIGAAAWEWSRMCAFDFTGKLVYYLLSAALAVLIGCAYVHGQSGGVPFHTMALWALSAAAVFWCIAAPLWLANTWRPGAAWIKALAGWLALFPAWFAFLSLRDVSPWALFSFAAVVWVADIAAYFAGRRFGVKKLAPAISPGKTRAGVYGALIGVTLYFFIWRALVAATPVASEAWAAQLLSRGGEVLVVFLLLTALSVVGDLFESWMKRGAGLKDSSRLLPGHGGVLDRIDALTSTLPLAALYLMLVVRSAGAGVANA